MSQEQGYLNLYNDGYVYIGEIKNGKPHGRGTLKSKLILDVESLNLVKKGTLKDKDLLLKYIGDWKDGKREGNGIEWWIDGSWWEGEFKNHYICNDCDGDYKMGHYFQGYIKFYTIKDGERTKENLYQMYKSNIDLREGDCVGDCDFGYGTLKYYNGTIYEGNFNNSERNGFGTLTNSDGKIEKGIFKDGFFVK